MQLESLKRLTYLKDYQSTKADIGKYSMKS